MRTMDWRLRGLLGLALLAAPAACNDDDDTSNQVGDGDVGDGDGDVGDGDTGDGDTGDGDGGDGDSAPQNIVDTAVAAGNFTALADALVATGLDEALSGAGPFTVFAPTDSAFEALGEETLSSLSTEELAEILEYHVVSGEVGSTDLSAGPVSTLSGLTAFVNLEGGVKINDANVTSADVEASNGVIHVIDKVLLPPNLVQAATYAGDFSTLLTAATDAGLAGTLSDAETELTVFAPTDEAFAALPPGTLEELTTEELTAILTYHVVSGEVLSTDLTAGDVATLNGESVTVALDDGVTVNDAKVIVADIVTTNGVIHVIDKVLLPPSP
jgi:transforming growth factor-beta-induced protein